MARRAEPAAGQGHRRSWKTGGTPTCPRAREIFAAFRLNLGSPGTAWREEIRAEDEMLFTDDQQAQRRRDIRAMEDRLASLDDEERREVADDPGALRRHQALRGRRRCGLRAHPAGREDREVAS